VNAAASSLIDQLPVRRFEPTLKVAPWVVKAALARGLIRRRLPASDTISFAPPFIVTAAEIGHLVARARVAVDAVVDELVRGRVWGDAA
jgi:L-2,4-diaminobutyrate transaminase